MALRPSATVSREKKNKEKKKTLEVTVQALVTKRFNLNFNHHYINVFLFEMKASV